MQTSINLRHFGIKKKKSFNCKEHKVFAKDEKYQPRFLCANLQPKRDKFWKFLLLPYS
jgi:hypothetical protein